MTTNTETMKITSPTLHVTIWFTISVFMAILVMSYVFRVEVVARGVGRVVPVSRVQVVQPEFSGQITSINVRNGVSVAQGDILIEFDPTQATAELGALHAETDRLQIELARVSAMIEALGPNLTDLDLHAQATAAYRVPDTLLSHAFAEEQRNLLVAQVNDVLASLDQIAAREDANRRSEEVTHANIARVDASLEIQSERLSGTEQLLERGTASRSAFLDVQQTFTELEGQRDIHFRELEQKIAQRAALNSERRSLIANLRHDLLERSARIDARLATLSEETRAARRRVDAATLRSPVSGIVDQLSVFTVGGVADAGEELLRIVPTDAEIEIEGVISNQDIGFLEVGQKVNIGLDAFPSERFGFVIGAISDISADSNEITEGQWGYVVRVKPENPFLQAGADHFAILPGMTATIDVSTDDRRIISYFFAPIVRTIQDAMGER